MAHADPWATGTLGMRPMRHADAHASSEASLQHATRRKARRAHLRFAMRARGPDKCKPVGSARNARSGPNCSSREVGGWEAHEDGFETSAGGWSEMCKLQAARHSPGCYEWAAAVMTKWSSFSSWSVGGDRPHRPLWPSSLPVSPRHERHYLKDLAPDLPQRPNPMRIQRATAALTGRTQPGMRPVVSKASSNNALRNLSTLYLHSTEGQLSYQHGAARHSNRLLNRIARSPTLNAM